MWTLYQLKHSSKNELLFTISNIVGKRQNITLYMSHWLNLGYPGWRYRIATAANYSQYVTLGWHLKQNTLFVHLWSKTFLKHGLSIKRSLSKNTRGVFTAFDPPLLNASTSSPLFLKLASVYMRHSLDAVLDAITLSRTAPGSNFSPFLRPLPIATAVCSSSLKQNCHDLRQFLYSLFPGKI